MNKLHQIIWRATWNMDFLCLQIF